MNLTEIGCFSKTHGIKGTLVLKAKGEVEWSDLKVLFVDMSGNKAPFFIKKCNEANQGILLELEEVDTVEKATALLNKSVYAEERFVIEEEEAGQWLGFEVIDRNRGPLGTVQAESNNGQHSIIEVNYSGYLVLLPMVEEFMVKIDEVKKQIQYHAPEGLIDLYLREDEEN